MKRPTWWTALRKHLHLCLDMHKNRALVVQSSKEVLRASHVSCAGLWVVRLTRGCYLNIVHLHLQFTSLHFSSLWVSTIVHDTHLRLNHFWHKWNTVMETRQPLWCKSAPHPLQHGTMEELILLPGDSLCHFSTHLAVTHFYWQVVISSQISSQIWFI